MKQFLLLSIITALLMTSAAEARVGGGRSFGSRGSRSVSPHYSAPQRSTSNPYAAPRAVPPAQAQPLEPRYGSGGGGFLRGMAGGLAGGMIGSMLFGNHGGGFNGGGAYGGGGGGGFGFLELILLVGLGFLAFRWFRRNQLAGAGPAGTMYSTPTPVYSAPNDEPTVVADNPEDILARYETNYSSSAYQEARTDDFFRIQAAFMARDLTSARNLLQPDLQRDIDADLAQLRAAHRINRLENITVRQTDVTEAWQEDGKLYATVHFKANLLDYVVDETTSEVASGSRTEPVKFEEYWTFARGTGFGSDAQWRLSAIEQA